MNSKHRILKLMAVVIDEMKKTPDLKVRDIEDQVNF